jgi:DNA-binding transcriptional LysR family regulator
VEFHQLRYFIAAAELSSMSQAAARVHVSQPALSRQIALLEDELGVALFDRVRQRIHLTEAGRYFLPRARQIVCDAETIGQQLQEQFGRARRTLRLGFLPVFLDDLVAPAVREFRQRHPAVQVSLHELSPRAQLDRIRAGQLDAGILGNIEEADRRHFTIQQLARYRLAAVVPDSHPLATKKSIRLGSLAKDDWVSLSDTLFPGRRAFLLGLCRRAGFAPRSVTEQDSLPLLLCAVAAGEGVAVIPDHAKKLPHPGCVFVPLVKPAPTAELLLVTPPRPPGAELATLIALVANRASILGG